MSGFTPGDLAKIAERSGGRCEVCGSGNPVQTHHRKPRRRGGTSGPRAQQVNAIPNALRLCQLCHDLIESNRAESLRLGRLVGEWDDPAETPVLLAPWCGEGWYLLTAWGGYNPTEEPMTP